MCGLFAAINIQNTFKIEDIKCFERLTDLSGHRGPDSKGSFAFNSFQKSCDKENFNIYLGHNRLSIIDLSKDGNQPLEDDGSYIIYNGEIFNYIELKSELIKEGVIFKTKTDTEVILKIYNNYGEDAFKLLNGMWAFIIYDSKKNKIIVSRDRFSIKPLFYYRNNDLFYFASEIKQLLPLLEEKKINQNILFNFLQQGILDFCENTFFEGIKRISPKSNFIIDLNNKNFYSKEYWDFEIKELNDENYLLRFKELFFDCINIRLRSDVEVGTLLSGGLDSSAISLVTHKLTQGKINTFSVVSKDDNSSEEEFIDILIKKNNINNTKLYIDHNEILKNLDKVIYHQDEPFTTLSIVAQYTILELIKNNTGITVVLSGQGGDEMLMGYLKYYFFYLKDLMDKKKFLRLFLEIILSTINRNVLFNSNFSLSKRYIPFLIKNNNGYLKLDGALEPVWQFNSLAERQKTDINRFSIPILSRYEDRNSMAHSIETRLPFLDHRLINFSLSLRNNLKIKNGWTKYILRKTMSELPGKIRWRRDKKGFTIPEETWFKNELKNQIYHVFQNSVLEKMGVIDSKAFLQFYDAFLTGKKNIHYSDISKVFIAEKWARNLF